jgi:hypothetical protein
MTNSLIDLLINAMEKRYRNKPKTFVRYLIQKALQGKISKSIAIELVGIVYSFDEVQKKLLMTKIEDYVPPKENDRPTYINKNPKKRTSTFQGQVTHMVSGLH